MWCGGTLERLGGGEGGEIGPFQLKVRQRHNKQGQVTEAGTQHHLGRPKAGQHRFRRRVLFFHWPTAPLGTPLHPSSTSAGASHLIRFTDSIHADADPSQLQLDQITFSFPDTHTLSGNLGYPVAKYSKPFPVEQLGAF